MTFQRLYGIIDPIESHHNTNLKTKENQTMDSVEIVASGYELMCPACEEMTYFDQLTETVSCAHCGREFTVSNYEHIYA